MAGKTLDRWAYVDLLNIPIDGLPVMPHALVMTNSKTLYHGSQIGQLTSIDPNRGLFGGVFCGSDVRVARSHGRFVTEIEIDSDKIATSRELHAGWTVALETVRAMPRYRGLNTEEIETLTDAACSDKECWLANSMDGDTEAYLSWEMQRVRGAIARALGFEAVEMDDEHGTSWLLLQLD